jgi:hypothetical protein
MCLSLNTLGARAGFSKCVLGCMSDAWEVHHWAQNNSTNIQKRRRWDLAVGRVVVLGGLAVCKLSINQQAPEA